MMGVDWQVNERSLFPVPRLPGDYVARYTDDPHRARGGRPVNQSGNAEFLAERVLVRPEAPGRGLADDRDVSRGFRILAGEGTAPDNRDAQRIEVLRRGKSIIGAHANGECRTK